MFRKRKSGGKTPSFPFTQKLKKSRSKVCRYIDLDLSMRHLRSLPLNASFFLDSSVEETERGGGEAVRGAMPCQKRVQLHNRTFLSLRNHKPVGAHFAIQEWRRRTKLQHDVPFPWLRRRDARRCLSCSPWMRDFARQDCNSCLVDLLCQGRTRDLLNTNCCVPVKSRIRVEGCLWPPGRRDSLLCSEYHAHSPNLSLSPVQARISCWDVYKKWSQVFSFVQHISDNSEGLKRFDEVRKENSGANIRSSQHQIVEIDESDRMTNFVHT